VKSAAGAGWDQATEFRARGSAGLRDQAVQKSQWEAGRAVCPARNIRNANPKSRPLIPRILLRLRRSRAGTNAAARHNVPETPVARD